MPHTKNSNFKQKIVIPNGMSEDSDTTESEDELTKVRKVLQNKSAANNDCSSEEYTDEDEDEDEQIERESSKSKKKKRIHWMKKSFPHPTSTFNENLPPPPTNDELKPIDYFFMMFGKESIELLREQSNLYSVQINPNKPVNISEVEIHKFIGILIMTGIYSFPRQRFYWSSNTRVESIASAMSRDRFLQIKKYLHVVDNSIQVDRTNPNFDRAFKVRPLLNMVKNNFRKIPMEQHLSVDEQIIPFKGKSIMKQHLPNKPYKWGYKMFLICSSASGICHDFVFYTGKGDNPQHGFCTDIVLQLCETVPQMANYKLYFDNYFTTIPLLVELKKVGIFATGTVRSNRLRDVVMKDQKALEKEGRGAVDYRVSQVDGINLCTVRWLDNKVVNCLSTIHSHEPIDPVKRWSSSEKKHIQVNRPNIVKVYNENMGGIDTMDMLISFYRINIRSKKYYLKIIFHLIDLCIANGWLLYRRHCEQLRLPKNEIRSLLQFRTEIGEACLKYVIPKDPAPRPRGRPAANSQSRQKKPLPTTTRAVRVQHPPVNIRSDGYHHWPISTTKGRCRHIGCNSYSTIMCAKCKLRLCINAKKNCFKDYHQ